MGDPFEHLFDGRRTGILCNAGEEVLLQRLPGHRRPGAQDRMHVVRDVFDLNARHG